MKSEFKLVLNEYEHCPFFKTKLLDNKSMHSWEKLLKIVIKGFSHKGYIFIHIAEMKIIRLANKIDISYDFYIKHIVYAVEWKIIIVINKNKTLTNKINRNWKCPLARKFNHVPILNM